MRPLLAAFALLPQALRADASAGWAHGVTATAAPLIQRFAGLLQAAALDPSPASLVTVVLLMALLPMTLVVPMSLVCLAAAAAFPVRVAVPVIMAGLMLNTAMAWGLARTVFGARLEAWLERRGGALASIRRGARENGLKWAILCRFIPSPFVAQPMVLASTGVGLGTTVLGSFIAMSPWVAAYVWVARAGRQGSLKSLGSAGLVLVAIYAVAAFLRWRYSKPAGAPTELLRPRDPAKPCLQLYTVPGHELSDEARAELSGLRERLGFEVDETSLGEGAEPALRERYEDHAPVALFDGVKLFNFKMDEHVLMVRLQAWRQRQGT